MALEILSIVGAIISPIVAFFALMNHLKTLLPRSRSRLKKDLEILNLLDEDHPKYDVLKKNVDEEICYLYEEKDEKIRIYSKKDFFGGLILFLFSLISLIFILYQDYDLILSVPLTITLIILLLGGIGGINESFKKKIQR